MAWARFRPMLRLSILALGLLLSPLETHPLAAQETEDLLEVVARTKALCAEDADSTPCLAYRARSTAIIANAVAEAGNTRDRGTFLAPVRALLTDPSPEIRTSALFALAKLQPDASDTPTLMVLLRDPVSNVRAGAWAAAGQSSDSAARRIVRRVSERPTGAGYAPDALAFDPTGLGFALPDGLEYLWLAADARRQGQLHFLTEAAPQTALGWFAALASGPAMPVEAMILGDLALIDQLGSFHEPDIYGAPMVLALAASGDLPARLIVVYQDLAFDQTGLAVVFADRRSLVPAAPAVDKADLEASAPLEDAEFDAALLRQSGFKPEADPEESDLFMAIVAAGGHGADVYLEVFPDGAYAAEARSYLAAPRIELGALSFSDTEDITVSFKNLPQGTSATIRIVGTGPEPDTIAEQYLPDAVTGTAHFAPDRRLVPGVYLVAASVDAGDDPETLSLWRDFSVTLGQAVLAAGKADYSPGEPIEVRFSGMSGDSQDYVSTAPAGAPKETFLQYAYTQGAREGTLTLLAPTAPGEYELRAFFREDESLLRASIPFTVSGLSDAAPGAEVAAPPTSGPAPEARANLALDKASFAPSEVMAITYSGMYGDPYDYVAVVAAGAPYSSYLQYKYTDGRREGTTSLTAPTAPGDYELRAFYMEDETILRASIPFTVE